MIIVAAVATIISPWTSVFPCWVFGREEFQLMQWMCPLRVRLDIQSWRMDHSISQTGDMADPCCRGRWRTCGPKGSRRHSTLEPREQHQDVYYLQRSSLPQACLSRHEPRSTGPVVMYLSIHDDYHYCYYHYNYCSCCGYLSKYRDTSFLNQFLPLLLSWTKKSITVAAITITTSVDTTNLDRETMRKMHV